MKDGNARFGDLIFDVNCLGCGKIAYSLPYRENTHHTMTCHRCGGVTFAHVLPGLHLAVATEEQRAAALERLAAEVDADLTRSRIRVRKLVPEHNVIASAFGTTIRCWDTHSGQLRHTLIGHTGAVLAVAFSPDGSTLASASEDKTVRIWNHHNGHHQRTLTGRTRYGRGVAFEPRFRPAYAAAIDCSLTAIERFDGCFILTATSPVDLVRTYDAFRVHLATGTVEVIGEVGIRCEGLYARVALGTLTARVIWADGTERDTNAIEGLTFEVTWAKEPRLPLVDGVLPLKRATRSASGASDREGARE